jgi:hypothetical protein
MAKVTNYRVSINPKVPQEVLAAQKHARMKAE